MALACLGARAAADPPSQPNETDRQFKTACLAFLDGKAAGNPAAADAAAYYRAHPEADLRVASADEMGLYFGKFSTSWDQVGGLVDSDRKILFMVEHPRFGIVLRDASGRLLPRPELDRSLALIAARLVHETSHLMLWDDLRRPLTGVVQNELLAHIREARYLDRELPMTADMQAAAANYQSWKARSDPGSDGAMRAQVAADFSRYGPAMMTQIVMLTAYRSGPNAFAKYVRDVYTPESGYWSVYADPDRPIAAIAARVADRGMPQSYRDYLLGQKNFWADDAQVWAARRYFDSLLPEYKTLSWPGEE